MKLKNLLPCILFTCFMYSPMLLFNNDANSTNYESTIQEYEGIVQEKVFQEGDVRVHPVYLNGTTMMNTITTPDEYTITVNNEEYEVEKEIWSNLEQGQTIRYTVHFGRIEIL